MKRFLAILSSSALAGTMAVAPVLADTGGSTTSNTTTLQHDLDCLALLFTNPAKHAQECGGPNFNPAPPPSSGGFGAACQQITAIDPFDVTGVQYKTDADTLVALIPCCGSSEITTPQRQLAPLFDTLWSTDGAWLVTATAGC